MGIGFKAVYKRYARVVVHDQLGPCVNALLGAALLLHLLLFFEVGQYSFACQAQHFVGQVIINQLNDCDDCFSMLISF